MDDTKGTAQTSIILTSNATISAQDYYITKFVTPFLGVTSISANTWNYSLAAQESNTQANFPRNGVGALYVNCYVWNTSTGAKVGTILDGATSGTTFSEPSLGAEKAMYGSFTGSAVASIPANCVIVFEVWARVTQGTATAYTDTFFYDGTTENIVDGQTVSNHASFIETPQSLIFKPIVERLTETLTLSDSAKLSLIPGAGVNANIKADKTTLVLDATSGVHDQAFTGIGFQPKAMIIWGSPVTANDTYNEGYSITYGLSDGTNNFSVGAAAVDNLTTLDASCMNRNDACICILSTAAGNAELVRGKVKTFDSDGVTITWAVKNTSQYILHATFIGGTDITNVLVKQDTAGTTSTGNKAYTGYGFQPDIIFYLVGRNNTVNTLTTTAGIGIGAAKSSTKQFNWSLFTNDNQTANTGGVDRANFDNAGVLNLGNGSGIDIKAALISIDSDGYTLNHINAPLASTYPWFCLAIKGGYWDVGAFQQRTSAGTTTFSQVVQADPTLFMLFGSDITQANTLQTSSGAQDGTISLGAADDTTEGCVLVGPKLITSPSTYIMQSTTAKVFRNATPVATATSSTLTAEADTSDMATLGQVTINYTTADAVARWGGYVVLSKGTSAALTRVLGSDTLKYSLLKQVKQPNTLKYNLIGRIVHADTLKYSLLKQVKQPNTLKYSLLKQVKQPNTLKYNLIGRVKQSNTIKYNLIGRIKKPNTLKYNLIGRITHQNTLKYSLIGRITHQNTLKYNLIGRIVHANTLKYSLIGRITKQNTLKYNLIGRIKHAATLKYSLLQQIKASRTLKYNLLKTILHANTLKYNLLSKVIHAYTLKYSVLKQVLHSNTLKYSLIGRIVHANTLKYNLLKQIKQANTLRYALLKQITHSDTLRYALLKQVKKSNTLLWSLFASLSRITHQNTLKYNLIGRVTHQNILKYSLLSQVKHADTLKYSLIGRIIHTFTLKYSLLKQVLHSNTLKYSLIGRVNHANTLKYNLLKQVLASRTLKYALLKQVTHNLTLLWSLFAQLSRILHANTLKYSLIGRVVHQNTLKYSLLKQVLHNLTLLWSLSAQIIRVVHPITLKYSLIQRVLIPFRLKYSLLTKAVKSNTLKYSLLRQVLSSRTLKYSILRQITHPFTLKYNIIQRRLHSNTLKYSLLKQVKTPKTLKYSILQKVTHQATLRYNILSFFTRVYKPFTLLWKVFYAQRPGQGGITVPYKKPKVFKKSKLKTILYPVYSQVEIRRIERQRQLRQFKPIAIIPAFQQSINEVVAPFVVTNPLNNTVTVKFALAQTSPVLFEGSVSIKIATTQNRVADGFFIASTKVTPTLQKQTRKMQKLARVIALWSAVQQFLSK